MSKERRCDLCNKVIESGSEYIKCAKCTRGVVHDGCGDICMACWSKISLKEVKHG